MTVINASLSENTPLPSKVFTSRELAEFVLQRIGAFTTMDSAANDRDVERTLQHMELVVAELSGTTRMQWLIPQTIEFELEATVQSYDLAEVAGTAYPALGIAYAIDAARVDSNDNETPIDIRRRHDYDMEPQKDTAGDPDYIVIDRQVDQVTRLYTYPVKADNDLTLSLRLRVQTYSRSVMGALAQTESSGEVAHGFDRSWQRWLVLATAYEVGDGPVRKLPSADLNRIGKSRDAAFLALMAFQNREKISTRLRRTRRYGG